MEYDILYFLTPMAESPELTLLKTKKKFNRSGSTVEQERNLVALCSLATLGVSTLGLVIGLIALANTNTIANKPMPTLVQTTSGKTMAIQALDGKQRSPKLLQDFTVKTLTNLFTWRSFLIPTNQEEMRTLKVDPGVPIEADGTASLKLPTPVWAASFAISDDFRKDFLGKHIAPLTTTLKVLQGSSETAFIPLSVQEPIEVNSPNPNEKLWKVKVVANLAIRTAANVPETLVPINKDIYLRAANPPLMPDLNHLDSKTDLQAVIAIARSSGLEIYGMEDFSKQDLTK